MTSNLAALEGYKEKIVSLSMKGRMMVLSMDACLMILLLTTQPLKGVQVSR